MRSEANKLERMARRWMNKMGNEDRRIKLSHHHGKYPACDLIPVLRYPYNPSLWPGKAFNVGDKLHKGTLHNWKQFRFDKKLYPTFEKNNGYILEGQLNNEKHKTRTTAVVSPSMLKKGVLVETLHATYYLGEPAWTYPEATISSGSEASENPLPHSG